MAKKITITVLLSLLVTSQQVSASYLFNESSDVPQNICFLDPSKCKDKNSPKFALK